MNEPGLGEALKCRCTDGNIYYWRHIVSAVGAVLTLTYGQVFVVWRHGENPWSLLAPLLAPLAIYFFLMGWAYRRPLPWLYGIVVTVVGCGLPFALIG